MTPTRFFLTLFLLPASPACAFRGRALTPFRPSPQCAAAAASLPSFPLSQTARPFFATLAMLGRRLRRLQRGGCGGAERLLRRSFSTRLRLCLQTIQNVHKGTAARLILQSLLLPGDDIFHDRVARMLSLIFRQPLILGSWRNTYQTGAFAQT